MLARIARHGPIRFDEVMEAALYDPEAGFYATGRPGRPARRLPHERRGRAALRRRAGACARRVVGGGGVAAPVRRRRGGSGKRHAGACGAARAADGVASALRYVLVERSARLRAAHADGLAARVAGATRSPRAPRPTTEEEPAPATAPAGPIAVSLDALPPPGTAHVVLANELLDNLPVRLLERADEGWAEVWVGADGNRLVEVLLPAGDLALAPTRGGRRPRGVATSRRAVGEPTHSR